MVENPLVHVPAAWPVLQKANDTRRRVVGRVRSVDMLRWDGVAYGDQPLQRMKIWELNDLAPRDGWPAVLLLHGGGWMQGSYKDFEALAPAFAHRGILAAAADYRLAPGDRWPAQIDDVLLAIDFLLHQQVDRRRIALWGHSAGGHLALMAALRQPEQVRCVVALGAPTDLRALGGTSPDDLSRCFDESQLDEASPLRATGACPPVLLVHGTSDAVCPVGHARAMRDARPGDLELVEVPDGDHGLRWPPVAAWRARRQAMDWLVAHLDLPGRGSKWKRHKKKAR